MDYDLRTLALIPLLLAAAPAVAADWTPRAWANASTIELRTTRPDEGEHWFPVWLVVIDNQVYVRLGSRAATRVEKNTTAPHLAELIAVEVDRHRRRRAVAACRASVGAAPASAPG